MNFTALKQELLMTVQDSSLDITTRAGDFINEALGLIAEETNPPGLKMQFTVPTVVGVAYASLPTTFSGRLTYAGTSEYNIEIADQVEVLYRQYPGLAETGDITIVAVENTLLYYQPIPLTVTNILCVGFGLPTLLVAGSDIPSFIPEFLHRELIVYRAAAVAYNLIEDGMDGRKVNTEMYNALYRAAVAKMAAWVSHRGKVVTRFKYYV